MYVVTDADRKNTDTDSKVYERFFFRHEAYDFFEKKKFSGVDGLVLFREDHWLSTDDETFAYGPYGDSDEARMAMRKFSTQKVKNFHTTVELVRI